MGILKTAMYSGAAMYGVKQIAKTAENRGANQNNGSNNQSRGAMDPEYLEYLEWKRRSTQLGLADESTSGRAPPQGYESDSRGQFARDGFPARQNLYLTDSIPPEYGNSFVDQRSAAAARYQPMEFRQPRHTGFVEGEGDSNTSGGRGGLGLGSLIGQGMNMLQSEGGNGGKGDFVGKFLKK